MLNQLNKSMVVFGEDWDGLPSSSQLIVQALLDDGWQIMWINSIGLRTPTFTKKDFFRFLNKLHKMITIKKSKTRFRHHHPENLTVINPWVLPFHGNRWITMLNSKLLQCQLKKYFKENRYEFLWLSLPTAINFRKDIPHKTLIYYCCDDFASLAGVEHALAEKKEQLCIQLADKVFISQSSLAKKFSTCQHKLTMIPHGVMDYFFTIPNSKPADYPQSDQVVGFYGSVSTWIDLKLIIYLASKHPDWHFLLIGPIQVNIESCQHFKNIQFLGPKMHHQLPAYVNAWQVSILPFKQSPQIDACSPLKLKEYLAVGTPILSIEFPDIRQHQNYVTICTSYEAFSLALKNFTQLKSSHALKQSLRRNHSWANRVKKINEELSHGSHTEVL